MKILSACIVLRGSQRELPIEFGFMLLLTTWLKKSVFSSQYPNEN